MHDRLRAVGSCLAGLGILLCTFADFARAADPSPAPQTEPAKSKPAAEPDEELPPGRVIFKQSKIEERIRKTLDEPVAELIFSDTKLLDVAAQLSATYKIPIAIDGEALGADGKSDELRISITIPDGASLRSALHSTLIPRGLTFVVENDRLMITTGVAAEVKTPTRVYQVHDLVNTGTSRPDFESLIELITSVIAPESWRDAGGTQGEAVPFHTDGVLALVITQTEAVHEQLESLFTDLRAARDVKVREMLRKQMPRRDSAAMQAEALHAALAARSADDKLTFPAKPAATELVAVSNNLGLRIYRELIRTRTPSDNLVVSPLGTVAALGPLYAGAANETAEEFQTALGFSPPAQFKAQFADLSRWINDPTALRSYRLRSRSHLFVQPSIRLSVGYVDTLRRAFDVTPVPLDFALGRAGTAKATIRNTAEADSDGFLNVGELMQAISDDARLAVVNTIDFRGRWTKPFPIGATTRQAFHAPSGPKQTDLMSTIEELDYYESAELQIVRKSYDGLRDAGVTSLYVMLPADKQDGLKKLETELTGEKLGAYFAEMTSEKVQLDLPRFTFDNTLRQNNSLKRLGLVEAFGDKADFSFIDGTQDLYLSSVEQKAKIEVNETETRAAATTVAVMNRDGSLSGADRTIPKLVRCDRPFLFLLRDDTTGAILFLGRLATPIAP